jgi:hypothetical protein
MKRSSLQKDFFKFMPKKVYEINSCYSTLVKNIKKENIFCTLSLYISLTGLGKSFALLATFGYFWLLLATFGRPNQELVF